MSEHTHNWQVGEEGAVVCLECAAVVGANDFIESLQAENAKLRKVADAAAEYLGDWDGDNQLNNLEDALEEAGYKNYTV